MRIIFLILVPLIILAVALTSDYLLLERLFILAVVVLFFSYLISFSGIWGIKGRLIQSSRYEQAGKAFFTEAIVENTFKWPKPFLGLKTRTAIRGSGKQSILINLPAKSGYKWRFPVTIPNRGIYKIGPLTVQSLDPFGLFRLQKNLDEGKTVLICPQIQELPFFTLSSQLESSSLRNNRVLAASGVLIAGVRDYVLGDSLSRVHWRSTAHRGKLVVKEYDPEVKDQIWIFLDLNKKQVYGKGRETTEEYGYTIAASILKKFCDAGQPVGLTAQGANHYYFPPRTGSLNMWQVMEAMVLMKADGRVPLPEVIDNAYQHLDRNSMAVIITASADGDLTEVVIRIQQRGIKVAVVLIDSFSFGGQISANQAANILRSMDVPTYVVKKGDNLSEALNNKLIIAN
jgi:uncharacterized protein (DUF58 family)